MTMTSYNIQTQQQGVWVNYSIAEDRDSALETAKRIFSNKACTGVRVMLVQPGADGGDIETEIHCETRVVKVTDVIRFSQIEWVPPPCAALDDYYAFTARRLMARILRDYCDKMVVTPTEVLYCAKEAARIMDHGTLVMTASEKVAVLQAGDQADKGKARLEEIEKIVEQIRSRARRADKLNLPKLKDRLSEAAAACHKIETQGEDPDYLALVVLAQDLSGVRNWLGKVYRLAKLAEADADQPESLAILDGVIADALAGSVVQDILGFQPSLGQALIAMMDLAEGQFVAEKSDAGEAASIINRFCGEGRFPQTRQSLIERVHRQVATGGALNRTAPEKEEEEFFKVRDRLLRPGALYNGPDTAEALTMRYARMVEAGGQAGRKAAFNGVFYSMPDRAMSIIYLCEIARTQYVKDISDDIIEKFDTIANIRSLLDMYRAEVPPRERLQRLTHAHAALHKSVFPPQIKTRLTNHLEMLADRFVIELKLEERLETMPVRDRAKLLAQFLAPGVLPFGRTFLRLRQAMIQMMDQSDFDQSFLHGADPAQGPRLLASLKAVKAKLQAMGKTG